MGYFPSGYIDLKNLMLAYSQRCWRIYLNVLQLNSNTLFFFDRAVLGFRELVGESHILQFKMFQSTNLSHLSSLGDTKTDTRLCVMSNLV